MATIININNKSNVIRINEWKNYENIPNQTRDVLLRYRDNGFDPGGFLKNVLTNNLFGAVLVADEKNSLAIIDICKWVHHRLPAHSWGDTFRVNNWIECGGAVGLSLKTIFEKE